MSERDYPTATEIRTALVKRAKEFSDLTGTPITSIGKQALNDSAFFTRLEAGSNTSLETYQKVHDWLTKHWPKAKPSSPRTTARAAS